MNHLSCPLSPHSRFVPYCARARASGSGGCGNGGVSDPHLLQSSFETAVAWWREGMDERCVMGVYVADGSILACNDTDPSPPRTRYVNLVVFVRVPDPS